jgi:hypothetical protein
MDPFEKALPDQMMSESIFEDEFVEDTEEGYEDEPLAPKAFIDFSKAPEGFLGDDEPISSGPSYTTPLQQKTSIEELHGNLFGDDSFLQGTQFINTLAEAESGRGKYMSNPKSSASGFFHFLVRNGGGYTKTGVRSPLGQYTKDGQRQVSSFQYSKDSLDRIVNKMPALMSNQDFSADYEVIKNATTPTLLSAKQQSLLAYAYLYNRAPRDFTAVMKGGKPAVELYAKEWVTLSGSHKYDEIATNWNRAAAKTKDTAANLNFIGIQMPIIDDVVYIGSGKDTKTVTKKPLNPKRLEKKKEDLIKKFNLL